MKSRRVTKFLAFGLAVCMTSVPVFAASTQSTKDISTQADLDTDVTVNAGFATADVVINVNVPTTATVRVQPLGTGNANTVSQSNVASKDLRIINKTFLWADEDKTTAQGVPLKVSARARFESLGQGVTAYFDKDVTNVTDARFNDASEKKNIWLQLREGTFDDSTDVSSNVTYSSSEKSTITDLGSKIIFTVSGPSNVSVNSANPDNSTVLDTDAGKAAMAIMGTAAKNAKWANGDVNTVLVYSLQTTGGTAPQTNGMGTGMTATNAGLVTIPEATLSGCEITGLAVQNAKDNSYGVQQLTPDMIDVSTTVTSGMQFTIKSEVMSNINSVKNTRTNLLVGLDDGRVLIADFVTPNN